jgi:hypothetical protein
MSTNAMTKEMIPGIRKIVSMSERLRSAGPESVSKKSIPPNITEKIPEMMSELDTTLMR